MRRVLVIDDDLDLAEALGELVTNLGHTVAVAHSGMQGCTLARTFNPDIVFCDLWLPEMDGYATARALRADPATATATLVALTGDVEALQRDNLADTCFDVRLAKPFGFDAVQRILR
jgi:CheY-like chemotaxis protein